jgi:hypothetical protein
MAGGCGKKSVICIPQYLNGKLPTVSSSVWKAKEACVQRYELKHL